WKEVGIDAKIRLLDAARVGEIWYGQESGDMVIGAFTGRADPLATASWGIVGPGAVGEEKLEMPEERSLIAEAKKTLDAEQRLELVSEIAKRNAEQALDVLLMQADICLATAPEVQDLEVSVLRSVSFGGVGKASE